MMRARVFSGAFAALLAACGAAGAQSNAETAAAPGNVPTVTILNKSAAPAEPAPPTLTVSPASPVRPAAPGAPARAATSPPVEAAPATRPAAAPAPAQASTPDQVPATDQPRAATLEADSKTSAPAATAPAPATSTASAEPPAPPPEPTLGIKIDLTRQVMTVSEHGQQKYTWRISSARYGYRTPTGTFQPTWMSKMWYSRQYDYAPMPHAIFFHKGVAIHATYATGMLGRPASHGCVRLAPKNAALLYKLVGAHGKARTEIVVHGTPNHASEQVASSDDYEAAPARRRPAYQYLPPGYASRRYAGSYYDGPPPGYYYAKPRQRRYYAAPRRYYQPRGLFNSYSYGYGF
jgi:lipoprotein-anchoring transpeptidase ErfK/SrfK